MSKSSNSDAYNYYKIYLFTEINASLSTASTSACDNGPKVSMEATSSVNSDCNMISSTISIPEKLPEMIHVLSTGKQIHNSQ